MKLGLLNVATVPSPFESGEDIWDRPASVVTALDDTLMARTVWKKPSVCCASMREHAFHTSTIHACHTRPRFTTYDKNKGAGAIHGASHGLRKNRNRADAVCERRVGPLATRKQSYKPRRYIDRPNRVVAVVHHNCKHAGAVNSDTRRKTEIR
jgi:hypothetical protein